jgi:hypothetical protein
MSSAPRWLWSWYWVAPYRLFMTPQTHSRAYRRISHYGDKDAENTGDCWRSQRKIDKRMEKKQPDC